MSIFNIFASKDINEGIRNFRESKNAILLDVRTREEYASGHIEGSRNLPLDEIDSVDSVVKDKNTPLYVHCLSGGRSARAAAYLKGKGYREVHDIGGIGHTEARSLFDIQRGLTKAVRPRKLHRRKQRKAKSLEKFIEI